MHLCRKSERERGWAFDFIGISLCALYTNKKSTESCSAASYKLIFFEAEMGDLMFENFRRNITSLDAQEFIAIIYRTLLGRDPDAEAMISILPLIRTRYDKLKIFEALISSKEFKKRSEFQESDRKVAEHFIDAILANKAEVRFIQVGANDGKNADFIRMRVIEHGWGGVLIEPHPAYIREAKKNYGDFGGLIWEEVAISDVKGEMPLFFVKEPPKEKPWAVGIASFSKDHLSDHGFRSNEISSISVPCVPLRDLIAKHKFFDADLLVVDVEGHELEVIKSINFDEFMVKLVILETSHMSRNEFSEILSFFPPTYRGLFCPLSEDSVIYRV